MSKQIERHPTPFQKRFKLAMTGRKDSLGIKRHFLKPKNSVYQNSISKVLNSMESKSKSSMLMKKLVSAHLV